MDVVMGFPACLRLLQLLLLLLRSRDCLVIARSDDAFGRRQDARVALDDAAASAQWGSSKAKPAEPSTAAAAVEPGLPASPARTTAELLQAFRAIDVSEYKDRRTFHLKTPKKRGMCTCCCCHPSVTRTELFDKPSAELSELLRRKGILGCAGVAAHLRMENATSLNDKALQLRVKRGTNHRIRRATFLGREAIVIRCGDNGNQCSDLGVATMVEKRDSPFIIDLLAYCPGGDKGTHRGTIVAEHFPHNIRGPGTPSTATQEGPSWEKHFGFDRKEAILRMVLGVLGAVKEYHSLGRFLADYGLGQHMVDTEGRTKIMDVDCALEIGQATSERQLFASCLGSTWKDWGLDTIRVDTRRGGRSPWISRERDCALAAAAVCGVLPHDEATESGYGWPSMSTFLEAEQQAQLVQAYRRVGDPQNRQYDLDSLMDALVGVLAPHLGSSSGRTDHNPDY